LDANFQLSQVAATKSACYGIKTQDRGVSIEDLKTHGLSEDICKLVGTWKKASDLMTDEQRLAILRKAEHWTENLWLGDRHTESEFVQVLREEDDAYHIVPVKVLTRDDGRDVKWCVGQEHGSIAPKQLIKPGDELELKNPFGEQEMKFVIRMLWETDYDSGANLTLTPTATNLKDLNDTDASDVDGKLCLKYRN
ncbi:hypothetical protein P4B35_23960, partial [Pontiellaceae bacterium B12227]|nr:hypothetical protein [Pontiellaceae bacterium B12227]